MESIIQVNFENVTPDVANQLAMELQIYLRDEEEIESDIDKEDKSTQDFGATLAIILGSGTAIALARGIARWLTLKQSKTIKLSKDGSVIGQNLSSQDIKAIFENRQLK